MRVQTVPFCWVQRTHWEQFILSVDSIGVPQIRMPVTLAGSPGDQDWVSWSKPTTSEEILGQDAAKRALREWFLRWSRWRENREDVTDLTKFKRVALITGPSGVGKTLLASIISRECGFEPLFNFANESRGKEGWDQLSSAFQGPRLSLSTTQSNTVIVVDDLEGLVGDQGTAPLLRQIRSSKVPVICIANDRQLKVCKTLLKFSVDVRLFKIPERLLVEHLLHIKNHLSLKCTRADLERLVNACRGDVRFAVTQLQYLSLGRGKSSLRDLSLNPFEASKLLYEPYDLQFKEHVMATNDLCRWFLVHNAHTRDDEDQLADTCEALSAMDQFEGLFDATLVNDMALRAISTNPVKPPNLVFPTELGAIGTLHARRNEWSQRRQRARTSRRGSTPDTVTKRTRGDDGLRLDRAPYVALMANTILSRCQPKSSLGLTPAKELLQSVGVESKEEADRLEEQLFYSMSKVDSNVKLRWSLLWNKNKRDRPAKRSLDDEETEEES